MTQQLSANFAFVINQIKKTHLIKTANGSKAIAVTCIQLSNDISTEFAKFIDQLIASIGIFFGYGTRGDIVPGSGEYIYSVVKPFTSEVALDLGMNNVPVLDQGAEGTCMTFSSTAALDAIIGKGDFIDQQCTLQLAQVAVAEDVYKIGGLKGNYWNGAYVATQIINPLYKHGIIAKGPNGCFGAKYANKTVTLPKSSISAASALAEYRNFSDKAALQNLNVAVYPVFGLADVKTALNKQHRFLVSFFLPQEERLEGFNITTIGVSVAGGLWACEQPSFPTNYCNPKKSVGGHAVIVIGYDDSQQLLKLRNSWGSSTGDAGDFYMTYTYFNNMVLNAGGNNFFTGVEVY